MTTALDQLALEAVAFCVQTPESLATHLACSEPEARAVLLSLEQRGEVTRHVEDRYALKWRARTQATRLGDNAPALANAYSTTVRAQRRLTLRQRAESPDPQRRVGPGRAEPWFTIDEEPTPEPVSAAVNPTPTPTPTPTPEPAGAEEGGGLGAWARSMMGWLGRR